LLNLIVGQTKIRKLLLTWLKTKHNITVLWHHIIQFLTKKIRNVISLSFCSFHVKCFSLIWQFYHNRPHSTHDLTWWWTHVQRPIIYYDFCNHHIMVCQNLLKD
jgi:hypothetical protein